MWFLCFEAQDLPPQQLQATLAAYAQHRADGPGDPIYIQPPDESYYYYTFTHEPTLQRHRKHLMSLGHNFTVTQEADLGQYGARVMRDYRLARKAARE